jgi:flavodoxin
MPKALIIFYSNTGNTRRIAEAIAALGNWPTAEIRDITSRRGAWGNLRCALESVLKIKPRIEFDSPVLSSFDLIIIGTPVWVGHIASPVRSFLAMHHHSLQRVAFFCTCGSTQPGTVFDQLSEASGKTPISTMAISDSDLKADTYQAKLSEFVKAL